jgi:hypothetical protein
MERLVRPEIAWENIAGPPNPEERRLLTTGLKWHKKTTAPTFPLKGRLSSIVGA